MRYRQGHKEQTRERLLAEAAAVIRLVGPERLSVATLMKRAGLTHGGFYIHFVSKDDLVAEAVKHMFAARQKAVDTIRRADPREALAQVIESYLAPASLSLSEPGCPIPILAGEHHRLPEAARCHLTLGVERLTGAIEDLLARAGIDVPSGTADSVVSEMIGAAALARVHGSEANVRKLLDAARRSVRYKLKLE